MVGCGPGRSMHSISLDMCAPRWWAYKPTEMSMTTIAALSCSSIATIRLTPTCPTECTGMPTLGASECRSGSTPMSLWTMLFHPLRLVTVSRCAIDYVAHSEFERHSGRSEEHTSELQSQSNI